MITQCPGCQTRFRVPLDQVASSRGEVFCGECHAQFNALDHLVIEEGINQGKPTLTERAQKSDDSAHGNTLFLPIDEDAIANLLSDRAASNRPLENESQPGQNRVTDGLPPQLTPITQSSSPDFTDTLIKQALETPEEITEINDSAKNETDTSQFKKQENVDASTSNPPPSTNEIEKYHLRQVLKTAPAERHQQPLWSTILALASIMLLMSTLGIEYMVVQREHFSQHPYFRPLLTTICPQIGCNIAPRRELSLLSIVDNRIETHPEAPEALLITAELTNRGPFEQNYPIVELVMTNIQQEVVANRNFYPDEYLPTFSRNNTGRFAANSSAQLELEVVDPGSHATGFEFILHNNNY